MVKIEQLTIGTIYTYKELCQLFEEDMKTSDSRAAQKKEWARYFSWSNPTARKYQIEEIYEVPRKKQDGRKNNGGNCTSKYLSLDDRIMSCMDQKEHMCCTISSLLTAAELLREDYIRNRWNHKEYKDTEWSAGVVNHVFWRIDTIVINAGKNSLERLKKEGYLVVSPRIVLVNQRNEKIKLSERRTQIVEGILVRVRKKMDLKPNELFKPERRKEYEKTVIKCIEEELKEQIAYYYRVYDITRTDKEYFLKTSEDIGKLTRKFVKSICMSILKVNFRHEFYSREVIAVQTVRLLNRQFTYMKEESWDAYFPAGAEDKMSEEDEIFFWVYYCPFKEWQWKEKKVREEREMLEQQKEVIPEERQKEIEELKQMLAQIDSQEQQEIVAEYRQQVVDKFGEEQTQELEHIIPNLNWKMVFESEGNSSPYMKYIDYLLKSYYNAVDVLTYVKDNDDRIRIVENLMNRAIKDYKYDHEQDEYLWITDLETPWTADGLEI